MPGKRTATESLAMLGIVKHAQINKVPKTQLCLEGFRLQSSNLNDKISLWTCTRGEFNHVRAGSLWCADGKIFCNTDQ